MRVPPIADIRLMRDWLYTRRCGAGRSAQRKHEVAIRRWRQRVMKKLRVPFAGAALVLFGLEMTSRHFTSWLLGLVLGALIAVYIVLRDVPPAHIERWRTGAEGERRTAAALAALRHEGYVLLHDLPDRRLSDRDLKGNIDHVVVSTAGVFLLDSKWLAGEASIEMDVVRVQMVDDEDESYELRRLASGMRGRALRLKEDIAQHAELRFVQAVVVFWNPFPAGLVEDKRVVYVEGGRLSDWLRQQSPRIAADRVPLIANAILEARAPAARKRWERIRARRPKRDSGREVALPTP
jgi:hypothetical protein